MKYQDNDKSVNGFYIGEFPATRTQDALAPADDGSDYIRNIDHAGTITQDAADADFPEEETP